MLQEPDSPRLGKGASSAPVGNTGLVPDCVTPSLAPHPGFAALCSMCMPGVPRPLLSAGTGRLCGALDCSEAHDGPL
jgi:hypothetical protein